MKSTRSDKKKWLIPVFILVLTAAGYIVLNETGLLQQIRTREATGGRQFDNNASETDTVQANLNKTSSAGPTTTGTVSQSTSQTLLQSASQQLPQSEMLPESDSKAQSASNSKQNSVSDPASQSTLQSASQSTEETSVVSRPESEIYQEMHEMANTKIVADQIWGEIEITDDRVVALIAEITLSNYQDKDVLLKILDNWQNGDFSNAVEEHNYLWDKLGGTVGKAYGLR